MQVKLLDYTSDEYISTGLAKISKYLDLTQAFAGATLITFSNGATDVITVIVASINSKAEGDDLAMGSLLGSTMFATTGLVGYVIYSSRGQVIEKVSFVVIMNLAE